MKRTIMFAMVVFLGCHSPYAFAESSSIPDRTNAIEAVCQDGAIRECGPICGTTGRGATQTCANGQWGVCPPYQCTPEGICSSIYSCKNKQVFLHHLGWVGGTQEQISEICKRREKEPGKGELVDTCNTKCVKEREYLGKVKSSAELCENSDSEYSRKEKEFLKKCQAVLRCGVGYVKRFDRKPVYDKVKKIFSACEMPAFHNGVLVYDCKGPCASNSVIGTDLDSPSKLCARQSGCSLSSRNAKGGDLLMSLLFLVLLLGCRLKRGGA